MSEKKVKIKICGLKNVSELNCAADYGALWYGMIFFAKSPRNISYKQAEKLINKTPKSIKPVAVTVNPSIDFVEKLICLGIRDIQLHGNETIKFCSRLKKTYKLNIIKAINVKSSEDLNLVEKYKKFSDWFLFDYKDKSEIGGTGKSFDWNIVANKKLNFNWILSGGLDYNNVVHAINITGAKALDVSSGVEVEKGKKSIELIKRFCSTINDY
ncbi:MAG: hypothetical protein CMP36_02090 [Rickettsiales bacterium]|nr:hypothetical protein [Rickettsiales bacterium]OUV80970.1 MAG: hypothetical protein CBC91_02625 [Rickettsiales bacterium TMED131]|tara:strand:+ start:931 stop:1569 length:639 start_codon:yes stop_codon:yes gene_type:complete